MNIKCRVSSTDKSDTQNRIFQPKSLTIKKRKTSRKKYLGIKTLHPSSTQGLLSDMVQFVCLFKKIISVK